MVSLTRFVKTALFSFGWWQGSCLRCVGFSRWTLVCLLFTGLMFGSGCGNSGQPVSPKIDLSKGRKTHEVDVATLHFPEGFPDNLELYRPAKIYEQDGKDQPITWDCLGTVVEVRDHYVAEFEKRDLEIKVIRHEDMPGENYEVVAFDSKSGLKFGVGMGKQREESGVACFVFGCDPKEEKTGSPKKDPQKK